MSSFDGTPGAHYGFSLRRGHATCPADTFDSRGFVSTESQELNRRLFRNDSARWIPLKTAPLWLSRERQQLSTGLISRLPVVVVALLLTASAVRAEIQNHITHGPIVGGLRTEGIAIWARTARPGRVGVRYGMSADRMDQVADPVMTRFEHDNTGVIRISGLKSDTKYYYELTLPDLPEQTGHTGAEYTFRTLPDVSEYRDPELNPRGLFNFSFEYASWRDSA